MLSTYVKLSRSKLVFKYSINALSTCYSKNIISIHRPTIVYAQQCTRFHIKSTNLATQKYSKNTSLDEDSLYCNNLKEDQNKDDENNTLNIIHKQFPEPKTTLHNYYQILSSELKSTEFKLTKPTFKLISVNKKSKNYWNCVFKIPWPEEIKIESVGSTKLEASKRASLKALSFLKRLGKISNEGFPIIYNKKQVSKENTINLQLSDSTVNKLRNIIDIYENHLLSNVETAKSLDLSVKFSEDTPNQEIEKKYYERNSQDVSNLPIEDYRKQIIDVIDKNQVTIIKGEPGCGKSTQVPQYIYDHWFANSETNNCEIIVSEPRRIAATSLAERVAIERNEQIGETVGYHVRLDSIYNRESGAILYCTSGILLKRLQTDPALKTVTHVVLDEAHERDVNTDLLMVLLRKAITVNPNLKVVIMSATIDVELFQKYFNNAPLIEIPGITYPVKSYFLDDIDLKFHKTRQLSNQENPTIVPEEICQLINWIHQTKNDSGAILCFLPGWDDILKVKKRLEYDRNRSQLILPLHSRLALKDQKKIFQNPPLGMRKIILATNIAETSVTIDDVVYVIDTGAHKEQRLDKSKQRECIDNYWISQSNVNQRKGRAGRVQPGESYHLFTREKYMEMEQFQLPVILRVSLTKLVLDTKVYDQEMKAVQFLQQLPSPPESQAIEKAVNELIDLKVLNDQEYLTPLGKTIALFSLPPTLAKALVYSYFFDCTKPVVDIVTALSLDSDIFTGSYENKGVIRSLKNDLSNNSDHIFYHKLMQEWRRVFYKNRYNIYNWCERYFINGFKMNLLHKLQEIHLNYLTDFKCNLPILNKYSKNDELVKSTLVAGLNNVLFNKLIINRRQQKKQVLLSENGQIITIGSDSVNYKRKLTPSLFYCYSNDVHSIARRTTIVRETSVIHPLTILLFVNAFRQNNVDNLAVFTLERNPNLKFNLDQSHGEILQKVKGIIDDTVQFLCTCHLQSRNLDDSDIYEYWIDIVDNLNSILLENSKL